MQAVRRLIAQRHLAALICAAALLLRLLVPSGYMIGTEHGHVAITICLGIADQPMPMAMPGMAGEMPDHGKKDNGKAEMPCPFASLTAPALGGADPVLLAALVAFIVALGILPLLSPTPTRRSYVRPPLRGPPAHL